MDIGHHHKFQASSNWVHQPYNMAMDAAGNMLDHGQNHHHEINPFGYTQWPNYNPNLQNQLSAENPLEEGGFKLNIGDQEDDPEEELGAMKEMMFKIASMQPVDIDPATICKPKRRNVRISDDPQSVAARHRRERISERIRILQRLVPGGTKLDTASMLDEAVRYVKFLKKQIRVLGTNQYEPGGSVPNVGPSSASPEDWLAAGVASSSSMANVGTSYELFGGNNVTHDHGPVCFN